MKVFFFFKLLSGGGSLEAFIFFLIIFSTSSLQINYHLRILGSSFLKNTIVYFCPVSGTFRSHLFWHEDLKAT